MLYTSYNSNSRNLTADDVLDATEYTVAAAGVMGADTTAADIVLCTAQGARLLFTPHSVAKPKNEKAKIIASIASIFLGGVTGNQRAASALELIAMGVIDSTIRE